VRLWDARVRRAVAALALEAPVSALATPPAPDASFSAAVGLESGRLLLLRGALAGLAGDLLEAPVPRGAAFTALQFSPNGQFLAAGSAAHSIAVIDVAAGNVALACTLKGHGGAVSDLDWSGSSRFLRSASRAVEELLFWDLSVRGGARVHNAAALRDEAWASSTCTFGWYAEGLPAAPATLDAAPAAPLLAAGGAWATVDIWRLPVLPGHPEPLPCRARAHGAAGVTALRWTADGRRLLSAGAEVAHPPPPPLY